MKNSARHLLASAVLAALAALAGGCAATAVKPWDRDLMAQKKMSFNPLPLERSIDEHIYFSKEGSTGGAGVGGGGCGCN
ncbi:MAG TPA: DUF4266 domain-containing protein [Candidatus Eisenbacteria bacterium]